MQSWRTDKRKTSERGYGWRWQQARLRYLQAHPLCALCLSQGIVAEAEVVDHVTPHRGEQELFWNEANWQALCKHHHDADKQAEDNGRVINTIGMDGWPT